MPEPACASSQPASPSGPLDAVAPPAAAKTPFSKGPTVHRTPELLQKLVPNHEFSVKLNFNDWRFQSECAKRFHSMDIFIPPYSQKTFSKSFQSDQTTWKQALEIVHKHTWEKWGIVQSDSPLTASSVQVPGEIPEDIVAQLQPIIEAMPSPKDYNKKKSIHRDGVIKCCSADQMIFSLTKSSVLFSLK